MSEKENITTVEELNNAIKAYLSEVQDGSPNAQETKKIVQKALESQIITQYIQISFNDLQNPIPPPINQLMSLLIKAVRQQHSQPCIDWIISLMKVKPLYKQPQISPPPNVVSDNAVIALPADPMPQPKTDAVTMEIRGEASSYSREDDEILEKYFQKQFKVVSREGVSENKKLMVERLCQQLVEPFFKKEGLEWRSPSALINLLQLLDGISTSVYTYYLICLFNEAINLIEVFLSQPGKLTKALSKEIADNLYYNLMNISARWKDTSNYSDKWQWIVRTKMIKVLLDSQISQTQLAAVKMLGQLCYKCDYSVGVSYKTESIREFIREQHILQRIYRADNHPQIIMKGKQIFHFLSKHFILDEHEINTVLVLLDKCHENVCKVIYSSLQSIGQTNLQYYYDKIMERIVSLPRHQCYSEETIQLVETLLIVAPIINISKNLQKLYRIIENHYMKLKKDLQQKIVNLYFELFVLGVEEGRFEDDTESRLVVLEPVISNIHTKLALAMLQIFFNVVKSQSGKKIHRRCKNILNEAIQVLFRKANMHHPFSLEERPYQLKLVRVMLQNYEGTEVILQYEELCELIEEDTSFCKFIQTYPPAQQEMVLESLINGKRQVEDDISHTNQIINVYYLLSLQVQPKVLKRIGEWFMNTIHPNEKQRLGQFIFSLEEEKFQNLYQQLLKVYQKSQQKIIWGYLIWLKAALKKADDKGFGGYPPFSYFAQSADVKLKVTNSYDCLNPTSLTLTVPNFQTISETIIRVLQECKLKVDQVKIKMGDMYITIDNLKTKIIEAFPEKTQISMIVYESFENEWFDKRQLITNRILNPQVIVALKEIFQKYTTKSRMYRSDCTKIFEIATETPNISENDGRINHLYSYNSQNGQFLTLQEWLNFYTQSAEDNPVTVMNNLKKLGYPSLFKNKNILEEFKETANTTRQFINNNCQRLYEILFTQFQTKQVQLTAIELLQLLPVMKKWVDTIELPKITKIDPKSNVYLNLWYRLALLYNCSVKAKQPLSPEDYGEELRENLHQIVRDVKAVKKHEKIYFHCLFYLLFLLRNFPPFSKIPQLISSEIVDFFPITKEFTEYIQLSKLEINFEDVKIITELLLNSKVLNWSSSKKYQLIESLMTMFCVCAVKNNESVNIEEEFIFHKDSLIRKIFNNAYFILSEAKPNLKSEYYSLQPSEYCNYYFEVLKQMLVNENSNIYEKLSQKIQNQLVLHDPREHLTNKVDQITLGRLNLLHTLKIYQPEILIQPNEWMKHLYSKCYTNSTRSALYRISNKVCEPNYNLKELMEVMNGVKVGKNSIIRGNKHMGLYNLGCICYINSTIQQLFMIEEFRNGIISVNVPQLVPKSYFYQFQYIIYQLTYGKRDFFIPDQFCLYYTDYTGQPVNIREQHDADEFMNSLFDRLEGTLKEANSEDIIGMNFRGKMGNIITCQTCFNDKVKFQDFYVLSLEIKNQKNLDECLEKLIQPEVITDFYCEFCSNKEMIHKNLRFESLPQYLFIHFQRLIFDLQSLTKIKLDHPVDYPLEIDLSPYFIDSDHEPVIYMLRGFIVHVGTSESGHYYSLVKQGNKWVKFDDSRVDDWNWNTEWRDKEGAYLLIYEKKVENKLVRKSSNQLVCGNVELMEKVKNDNWMLLKETLFLQPSFPEYLLETIKTINLPNQFINTSPTNIQIPCHPDYLQLPQQIINQLQQAHDVILQFFLLTSETKELGLVNWDYNPKDIQNSIYFLLLIYHLCPKLAEFSMKRLLSDPKYFRMIYVQSDQTIRQAFKLTFVKLASILTAFYPVDYLLLAPKNTGVELIQDLFKAIINGLSEVGKHYNKMKEYFELIYMLCRISENCLNWFQKNNLGPKLVHFLMQNDSPLKDDFDSLPLHNFVHKKLESINIVTQIMALLCRNWKQTQLQNDQKTNNLRIKAYSCFGLYKKLHGQKYNFMEINQMLGEMCVGNKQLSDKVMSYVKENINRFSHEDSYIFAYVHLTFCLLTINDELKINRLSGVLGVPTLFQLDENVYLPSQNEDRRRCKYWNNSYQNTDEIILPFLQVLYTNKQQINYFTLMGTLIILRLITNFPHVKEYILDLPSPSPVHKSYISWFNLIIKNGLNEKHIFGSIDKNETLNEIASLVNELEEEEVQNKKRQWYLKSGKVKARQEQKGKIEDIEVKFKIFQSQETEQPMFIQFQFNIDVQIRKLGLQFIQWNHFYYYQFEAGIFSIVVPFSEYPNIQNHFQNIIRIVFISRRQIHLQKQAKDEENPKIVQENKDNVNSDAIAMENREQPRQVENIFECPFCTSISYTFASRCPTCGEEWGQMM